MTRDELIHALGSWNPVSHCVTAAFRERDALQFALWWYGASTESDKPNPSWPGEDYVASNTGSGIPRYLYSVDAALSLIPKGWAWSIQMSDRTGSEVLLYPPNEDDQQVFAAGTKMPVAICMVAIEARIFASKRATSQ